ncbi:hypothetical protein [Pseudodesulfovibrio piezophilus]|uniref:Uncharacterized protein n=1 Tax=Pseudodesulfovibrio piezophilus (strain DSM 21447 / JCM 15486 / C1TLV30) TaxID=1322246 RepID=M1WUR6_PSEP2|nr:hypothetical protein [Pseudodesulfovibrio piezophilus]CCH47803.1 protein of unknown function [Pseudodesulfovibrio piezophilus C1TLV30]
MAIPEKYRGFTYTGKILTLKPEEKLTDEEIIEWLRSMERIGQPQALYPAGLLRIAERTEDGHYLLPPPEVWVEPTPRKWRDIKGD